MSANQLNAVSIRQKIAELKALNKKGDNTKIDSKKEAKALLKFANSVNISLFDAAGEELFSAVMESIAFLSNKKGKKQESNDTIVHKLNTEF